MHESGEWIATGQVVAPVSKHDAQGFGSAQTYARRYSLQMAFGVPAEDDDGNAAAQSAPAKERAPSRSDIAYNAFEKKWIDHMRGAAKAGVDSLSTAFKEMPASDLKTTFWAKHGESLKAKAQEAEHATADA
jgi:hypothetical protein